MIGTRGIESPVAIEPVYLEFSPRRKMGRTNPLDRRHSGPRDRPPVDASPGNNHSSWIIRILDKADTPAITRIQSKQIRLPELEVLRNRVVVPPMRLLGLLQSSTPRWISGRETLTKYVHRRPN